MNTNFNLTQTELFGPVKLDSGTYTNSNPMTGLVWALGGLVLTLSIIVIQQNQIKKKLKSQLKLSSP